MSHTRRLLILVVLVALALGLVGLGDHVASADARTKKQINEKLELMRAKIKHAKKSRDKLSDQIATIDARLSAIDDKLTKLNGQIDAVQGRLTLTQEKLAAVREQLRLKRLELAKAQRELDDEEANLEMRAVTAYKSNDLSYVDVVLGANSFEDLVTRTSMVSDLVGSNNDLVGDLERARNKVRVEKNTIAKKEKQVHDMVSDLQKQEQELASLRAAQQAQAAASREARGEKRVALRGISKNLAEYERQEQRLLAESAQITGMIRGSSNGGHGTGSMMWPVNGPVASPFGYRIHPILGYRKLHTGLDFGVGYGTPIKAADSGSVTYASGMGGYGNVVILSHGRGISTLYAHMSSFAVSGGSVSKGQTVGYVGSTGFSTGAHLHFEVRLNGSPVNPLGYLN